MREHHRLIVHNVSPPTIEVDSEALAVYIRFKKAKVAKTIDRQARRMVLTVDLDSKGEVIGIEAVGIDHFGIDTLEKLVRQAHVQPDRLDLEKSKFAMGACL